MANQLRRIRWLAAMVLAVLALAGCFRSLGGELAPTPQPVSQANPNVTPPVAETETPTPDVTADLTLSPAADETETPLVVPTEDEMTDLPAESATPTSDVSPTPSIVPLVTITPSPVPSETDSGDAFGQGGPVVTLTSDALIPPTFTPVIPTETPLPTDAPPVFTFTPLPTETIPSPTVPSQTPLPSSTPLPSPTPQVSRTPSPTPSPTRTNTPIRPTSFLTATFTVVPFVTIAPSPTYTPFMPGAQGGAIVPPGPENVDGGVAQQPGLSDGQGGGPADGAPVAQAPTLTPTLGEGVPLGERPTETLPPAAGISSATATPTPTPQPVAQEPTLSEQSLTATALLLEFQLTQQAAQGTLVTVTSPPAGGFTPVPTQPGGQQGGVFITFTPAGTTFPSGVCSTHIINVDETLTRIALQYNVSVNALVAANNITNPDLIDAGSELLIPCPLPATAVPTPIPDGQGGGGLINGNIYVVQEGDNLYRIALRFNVTMSALMAANGLTLQTMDLIYVGQELVIPGGAVIGTPTPTPLAGQGGGIFITFTPAPVAPTQDPAAVPAG